MVDAFAVGEALVSFVDEGGTGSFRATVAGAELNALVAMQRCGATAVFTSRVGDDRFGRLVRSAVIGEGIGAQFGPPVARRTGVMFRDLGVGDERSVVYYREGSAASGLAADDALQALARSAPRAVIASGLTLGLGGGLRGEGLGAASAAVITRAASDGTPVFFDVNLRRGIWEQERARADFAELVDRLDYVIAGDDELCEVADVDDAIAAARRLVAGGRTAVAIKRGGAGCTVVTAEGLVDIPPTETVAVDTVGAGDAFTGAFAAAVLAGRSPEDAGRAANAAAADVVATAGDWLRRSGGEQGPESVLDV